MANQMAGVSTYTGTNPEQLLAGDTPIKTDSAIVSTTAVTKYLLCALLADGTITPFVGGTHTAAQACLAMEAAAVGVSVPYAHTGTFNDALITYPAHATLDTYIERRNFFTGTFKVSHLVASV